jgi:hypothetical protein
MRTQIATIPRAPLSCAQAPRIQASFPEPVSQFAHRRVPSSFVASDVKQHSEEENGTVLYQRGEFPDQQGARQHERG